MTRWTFFRKNFVLALRRAPRDRRALALVLSWLGLLAYVAYLSGAVAYYGIWMVLIDGALLALATVLAALIARSHRRQDASLLRLSAPAALAAGPCSSPAHREALARELLRTATLVDRAGCELIQGMGLLPEEHRGLCRRRTLDLARREDLWPGFAEAERELLYAPEGSWPGELAWQTSVRNEDVRVLRFVLGLDQILTPFEFLEQDLQISLELTIAPDKVEGRTCLEPMDLRPAQGVAEAMLARCVVEGSERGLFAVEDEDLRGLRGAGHDRNESTDLLIGSSTVGHAEDGSLRLAGLAAYRRARTFKRVIAFLYSREPTLAEQFRIEDSMDSESSEEM